MNTLPTSYKNRINEKHKILTEGLKKSVKLAVQIGQLLTEAKDKLEHGQFIEWVNNNCLFTDRTAENYMKLYRYKIKR